MKPRDFIRTLYLGDRACKAIIINGWKSNVRVQVNCISRVRSASGTWDYYVDEDIAEGFLVFSEVQACELNNGGHLPNDSINSLEVVEEVDDASTIEMSIDAVDKDGYHHETYLRVTCKTVYLEDPARQGVKIET